MINMENKRFLEWFKKLCENHPDVLRELGWEKVREDCTNCEHWKNSCVMCEAGGKMTFGEVVSFRCHNWERRA